MTKVNIEALRNSSEKNTRKKFYCLTILLAILGLILSGCALIDNNNADTGGMATAMPESNEQKNDEESTNDQELDNAAENQDSESAEVPNNIVGIAKEHITVNDLYEKQFQDVHKSMEQHQEYSYDELVEIALNLLSYEDTPILWWLRGENLDINEDDSGIAGNDFEHFKPIMRFNSLYEMKTATEQVVSKRFAEEHLYVVLDMNPRMFFEYNGQLFFNVFSNGGWIHPDVVYGSVISRDEYSIQIEIKFEWDPPLVMADMDRRYEVYIIKLVNEDGLWKIDTWPGELFDNPPVRVY